MPSPPPSSKEGLEAALDELLVSAFLNGVEVADGNYELRHASADLPDWEVMIHRLEREDRTETSP